MYILHANLTSDLALSIGIQLCLKWGLKDSTIFISWGSSIYSMEVHHSLPSLQFLARQTIKENLEECQEKQLQLLPLPKKEIKWLSLMNRPIVPVSWNLHILILWYGNSVEA